jgi:hypothetical protein
VRTPGFAWSYPGYKADRTIAGVIVHELGHHIWDVRVERGILGHMFQLDWDLTIADEARVSSYEPVPEEAFAESIKLYGLNPDLLRVGRPERFYALHDHLELPEPHRTPWRDVLVNAHPKLIAAAEKWIAKGCADVADWDGQPVIVPGQVDAVPVAEWRRTHPE